MTLCGQEEEEEERGACGGEVVVEPTVCDETN